jgi:hypothetical protein
MIQLGLVVCSRRLKCEKINDDGNHAILKTYMTFDLVNLKKSQKWFI